MNKQRRKDATVARIDNELRDATSEVHVIERMDGRWDIRCYTAYGPHQSSRRAYIGGISNVTGIDKAKELAEFYAPCSKAITWEVRDA